MYVQILLIIMINNVILPRVFILFNVFESIFSRHVYRCTVKKFMASVTKGNIMGHSGVNLGLKQTNICKYNQYFHTIIIWFYIGRFM